MHHPFSDHRRAAACLLAACACPIAAAGSVELVGPSGADLVWVADEPESTGLLGDEDGRPWSLQFEVLAYRPATAGDFNLIGTSDIDTEWIELDEPVFAPFGKLVWRYDDISLRFRSFGLSTESTARSTQPFSAGDLDIQAGDLVDAELDYFTIDAAIGYRFEPLLHDPSADTSLLFDVFVGVRAHDIEFAIEQIGVGSERAQSHFVLGLIGAQLEMDLPRGFGLVIEGDGAIGAGDSGFSIDAGFFWNPWDTVRAELGFRHYSVDLEDEGAVSFDGYTAGLYFGIGVEF